MLSWVSPVLGWALKCLAQGHSHEKIQRIQCGSNPGPLDYESNTLPLHHAGPTVLKEKAYENLLGKEENAGNQQCILFTHCFLYFTIQYGLVKHFAVR